MGSVERSIKKHISIFTYKLSNDESVNLRALDLPSGFIHVVRENRHNTFYLKADVTGLVSVKDSKLYKGAEENLIKLILNIADLMMKCKSMGISDDCFELSADAIFVDPHNIDSILMIYWPVTNYHSRYDKKIFFEKLPYEMGYAKYAPGVRLSRYKNYMRDKAAQTMPTMKNFVAELKKILKNDSPGQLSQPLNEPKQHGGIVVDWGGVVCPNCGYDENNINAIFCRRCNYKLSENDSGETDSPTTCVFDDSFAEDAKHPAKVVGRLVSKRLNLSFKFESDETTIGRSHSCNYCIDSIQISRQHAKVIKRDNRFYILDTESLNHTYVDNRMIGQGSAVELFDGTSVKLADIEFVFILEEE